MAVQNHRNHRRYVPGFHFLASSLCLVAFIAAIFNLVHNWEDPDNHLGAAIILVITMILFLFFWFIRSFALRAQDRAIRAEEKLRHFLPGFEWARSLHYVLRVMKNFRNWQRKPLKEISKAKRLKNLSGTGKRITTECRNSCWLLVVSW
jgi:Family of unknown function (DUF6526)